MTDRFQAARSKKRGFTLIELLVVIAIIAILAAILFPVFAQAREKARQSACLNNTKQMALAVQTYMQDWDGSYPGTDYAATAGTSYAPAYFSKYGYGFWMAELLPFVKTWNVFHCPSSPKDRPDGFDPKTFPFANYSFNEYLLYTNRYTGLDHDYNSESDIPNPSETALIADGYNASLFHDWDDGSGEMNSGNSYAPDHVQLPSGMNRIKWANGNVGGRLQSRHNGTNIVFADAHAKYFALSKFYCKGGAARPADPKQRVEVPIIDPLAHTQ
jgi:prepilin-type N-terminal cleavage/methylation domain-containing protein/prepilin-type processing-associated H-X9-DG protein